MSTHGFGFTSADFNAIDEYFSAARRPRWRVERSDTISIPFTLSGRRVESLIQVTQRWWAFPDDGTEDLDRGFPTWREAFDYATRMAHQ